MAKKSQKGLSVLSTVLSGTTIALDSYNYYVYRSKNKKLSYLSLGLGSADMLLDFYLSFSAKNKFVKAWSLFSLSRQLRAQADKFKSIKNQ
ncbi:MULTISPECIES: hypothetical protein [unclassified Staphylococcus]|uniref:hypothetical protein n=1 Tax=unclassified Staphylococcus TaxID=91994 RepID=UPI0021CF1547|nr:MULTISPECIES: hypothetical protein [unclassified Staphylococcus]UXR78262.1 hypothetical protein MUA92_10605 [Staphylococcus sp. IVB6227]UXR82426.1 hypothetical protein MUA51_10325 [Staphylococcus sp. IVB6214]